MAGNKPLAFLLLLFAFLTFLVGFRWGKQVERSDKSYVPPTIIPSPTTPEPTITQAPILFETYVHKGCGIAFSLPKQFAPQEQSSQSGAFTNQSQRIVVHCDRLSVQTFKKTIIDVKPLDTVISNGSSVPVYELSKSISSWIIKNRKGESVLITSPKELSSIVIKTIDLVSTN